jgi:ABC-2 type transport system ATP-binding protein
VSTYALHAAGLVKDYPRGRAVDGVDLVVHVGERVALLGPNGAGKTTTLLMCLAVITPDAGTVSIFGRRLPEQRTAALARMGFVAGYLPPTSHLKVIESLRWFGRLYGLRRPDAAARAGLEGIVKAALRRPALIVAPRHHSLITDSPLRSTRR